MGSEDAVQKVALSLPNEVSSPKSSEIRNAASMEDRPGPGDGVVASPRVSETRISPSGTMLLEVRPMTAATCSSTSSCTSALVHASSTRKKENVRFEVDEDIETEKSERVWRNSAGIRKSGNTADESVGRSSALRTSAYPGRVTTHTPETDSHRPRITQLRTRIQHSNFYHGEAAKKFREFLHGKVFLAVMTLALFIALFLPEVAIISGVNSNTEIDIILTFVMFLFTFELFALSALDVTYFLSFFFFMDIVGTASMIFDISYMVGIDNTKVATYQGGDSDAKKNLMLLRAARAARVGARAGRLSRVLRILRFLPFLSSKTDDSAGMSGVISRQLANLLATRVACLTIILVIAIPIFDILSFPQDDHAMQAWVESLSESKTLTNTLIGDIPYNRDILAMVDFFRTKSYGPYLACLGHKSGDSFVTDSATCTPAAWTFKKPKRAASALWVHTDTFVVGFNMQSPHGIDHGLAILNIFFIISIMVFSGLALSNVVTELAVRPLENMLKTVRKIAEETLKFSSAMMIEDEDEGEEFDINTSTEMKLLEKVVQKLAIIAELQNGQGNQHHIEDMGEEDIGILNMMEGKDVVQQNRKQEVRRFSLQARSYKKEGSAAKMRFEDIGVSAETYNSYAFNTLVLTKIQMSAIGVYVVIEFHDGSPDSFINTAEEKALLGRFVTEAEKNYPANPFHNFSHATDVLHGVAKMMRLMSSENFLTELEQFSLLIAAISHDLAHPGVNNVFLLEVGHELAIQYNDLSPLENMHVSKLYSIVSSPETNVFSMLTKEQYKEVRKYCIETILHTDMVGHQAMVKDLQMVYQMNLEIFTKGDSLGAEIEVFNQPETKMLVMDNILHSADVSNPCRIWEVSHAWAQMVLEEFFCQGDQEKMIGVPVGFLNDREKLNRPNSQIGFLEFMIAPFFAAQIRLFHKLHEYGDNLSDNIAKWEDMWAKEANPDEEARSKVKGRIDRVQTSLQEAKQSSERVGVQDHF